MPGPPHRPHRTDALIAATGMAAGLVMWSLDLYSSPSLAQDRGDWALLPLAAMCTAELLRRVWQPGALLLACAAFAADQATGSLLVTVAMFTDLCYAAVMYGPPRVARVVPPAFIAVSIASTALLLALLRDAQALLLGAMMGLLTVGSAFTGLITRAHRDAAAAERLRAEQTRLLAEIDRTQAVTAERSRVARELHDVVANHLSAIALHSTAALSLREPETTQRALRVIRENSTQGLTEMRRLIGLLRDGSPETPAPTPSLDGLGALVTQAGEAGAARGLRFTADDRRTGTPLPAPVELAAYRIVQESLANAVKHGAPGHAAVLLDLRDDTLHIDVTSPHSERPTPAAPGTGSGLTGMRERAALLGGDLTAGPDGGVWHVRAALPLEPPLPSQYQHQHQPERTARP
ncbi:sensor histidine kinase [Streptomyces sp. NPDC049879]|uniref:sensor histidine kinase n=1 Tax=Streptomyces sp. NPDC049879 TaxID=3365598 RepID=UPI0037A3CDCE